MDEIPYDVKLNYILDKSSFTRLESIKLPENLILKNKPAEAFHICKLCSNILLEPKACAECEDLFCNSCLKAKLSEQNECPFCREAPFKEAKYSKQLAYILNQMVLKCPLGCSAAVSYEDLQSHVKNCACAPIYFKCELCDLRIKVDVNANSIGNNGKDLFSEHNKVCPNVLRTCVHCNEEFPKAQLPAHMKYCEYKLYFCATCKMKFPGKFRLAHNEYYCRQITQLHKIFDKIMQNLYT